MASIFVQITTGPEHPTKAALGLLVARSAMDQGHEVTVFMGGDGVDLAREETRAAIHGIGSGSAKEHWDVLVAGGARFVLSKMSSKDRGITPDLLEGVNAEMVMPSMLVELSLSHDRMFSY